MSCPRVHYVRRRTSLEMPFYLTCSTRTQETISAAVIFYLHYYLLLAQTQFCLDTCVLWLIYFETYFLIPVLITLYTMPPGPIIMDFD